MSKKKLFILIGVGAALISAVFGGCKDNSVSKTFKTDFGDTITVYSYISNTLHDTFLKSEIRVDGSDSFEIIYEPGVTELPSDIESDFEGIVRSGHVSVYRLYSHFIIINDGELEGFSVDYGLQDFLINLETDSLGSKFLAIQALCSTKDFDYIKQFAPILILDHENDIVDVISDWASGSFTDEELAVNSDHSKESIIKWCAEFLENNG